MHHSSTRGPRGARRRRWGRHALLPWALVLSLTGLVGSPAQSASAYGDLVGTVVDTRGVPLVGVQVVATPSGSEVPTDDGQTEDGGHWALSLPLGEYSLTFSDPGERYRPVVLERVLVIDGAEPTVLAPVVLTEEARGALSGLVQGQGVGAVAGASVTLVRGVGRHPAYATYEDVATVETDAAGRYAFQDVPVGPGRWYTVRGEAPEFRDTYLDGSASAATARFVEMTGPGAFPDLQLRPDPGVSGVVSGPDGAVSDVVVELLRWEDGWTYAGSDETDASGRYRIPLSVGTYTLRFDPYWSTVPLREQWLGADHPTTPEDAETFTVAEPVTPRVRDVQLLPAPAVRGRVVRGGVPQPDVVVTPYVWDAELGWVDELAAVTGPDGRFATRVPERTWMTFRFSPSHAPGPLLDGAQELPGGPDADTAVWTGSDGLGLGTLDLDAPAPGLRQVVGRVVDQLGRPVTEASFSLVVASGPRAGTVVGGDVSGDDGRFGFAALPGSYAVTAAHPTCSVETGVDVVVAEDQASLLLRASCPVPGTPPPVDPPVDPPVVPPTGPPAVSPGPTPPATPGKAAATVSVRVPKGPVRLRGTAVVVVKLRAGPGGSVAGKVTLRAGTKVVATTRLTGAQGRHTLRLRVPARKLGLGTHRLQAVFAGNPATAQARSARVRLTVRR